ncbi:o-succinylbenzoate--CoA ligase [Alkalihalobacillus sp. AL-G]|uniref:o-succinylbenzoate--CoA ligase n=1 Tax=Alkalihalobacillus sp. AL-G TaxID=2926399 RepID=UPI00272A5A35|nr:o-succinylbenzoate--CoA ligase [Alkalihalobacillus sp. AL-G]WLD92475.1 o-succinylbenzoate--CoA ligase [Alkalihalobacillus sp. AL-G]
MSSQEMRNWLGQRAYITPTRTALVYEGKEWSYEELDQASRHLANQLSGIGVEHGQHVAFLMGNCPETVILIHAIHYLNAVMVPLNVRLSPYELTYQLDDSDTDWLIVDLQHSKLADELQFDQTFFIDDVKNAKQRDARTEETIHLDSLHSIIYTSGTTGKAKGVMLTYGNHWWSATGSALNLGIHEGDRWLCCVPLFHVSGLSIVMRSVMYGTAIVLHQSFDPFTFNQSIHQDRITIASVVTVMLSNALDRENGAPYPASFRCMLLGGGPAPLPLLDACKAMNVPVFQTYGLSESASQIVTLAPEDSLRKLGSAGKPLLPSQLKIVSETDQSEGEIFIKGPNVTKGYYKKETVNKETFHDGWLATGDVGYLDEEGFLYVLDRRKDLFISGGENVYPAEIEACLIGHEAVAEAGVSGVDSEKWGKVPAAFIVLKKGAHVTTDQLIAHCEEHLAKYKAPQRIQIVDSLPRNASNKLVRRDLQSLLKGENVHDER